MLIFVILVHFWNDSMRIRADAPVDAGVEAGADVNVEDGESYVTPLHLAAARPSGSSGRCALPISSGVPLG